MSPTATTGSLGMFRTEEVSPRIRAQLFGEVVADSYNARLVFVEGRSPAYFLPSVDVRLEAFDTSEGDGDSDELGRYQGLHVADGELVGRHYQSGPAAGLVHLRAEAMDAWFEEEDEAFARPRDPYRRVDVFESSRHVRVEIDGVPIAETARPRLLVETGLPDRWYLPRADIDWSMLRRSETLSTCQYKGTARYWHAVASHGGRRDVAWSYEHPVPELPRLSGLVAFDAGLDGVNVIVDDVTQLVQAYDPSWMNPSLHLSNLDLA